jgi:hypothetical protein
MLPTVQYDAVYPSVNHYTEDRKENQEGFEVLTFVRAWHAVPTNQVIREQNCSSFIL